MFTCLYSSTEYLLSHMLSSRSVKYHCQVLEGFSSPSHTYYSTWGQMVNFAFYKGNQIPSYNSWFIKKYFKVKLTKHYRIDPSLKTNCFWSMLQVAISSLYSCIFGHLTTVKIKIYYISQTIGSRCQ